MTVEESKFLLNDEDEKKKKLLNKTELDEVDRAFSINSLKILKERYLLRNDAGDIVESPKQLFERVAILAALGDVLHDDRILSKSQLQNKEMIYPGEPYLKSKEDLPLSIGEYKLNKWHIRSFINAFGKQQYLKLKTCDQIIDMFIDGEFDSYEQNIKQYYDLMANQIFMPNTPTLMNAGTQMGQLSACFVLPVPDSIDGMMDVNKQAALIYKSGGGVGFNFSAVRCEGSPIKTTGGTASGPISFMGITDAVSNTVKQGGRRRAANMGILHWTHPDVKKFVTAKTKPHVLENFNISVGTDEKFWENEELVDLIAKSAWQSAEPGLIFLDRGNEFNVMRESMGDIITTNPCGEQFLYPYESCNLGSINIAKLVMTQIFTNDLGEESIYKLFNMTKFREVVGLTTRFLDNIIDMNNYPLEEIDTATKNTRRIGLGIMGVADMLHELRIPYNSNTGRRLVEDIFEYLAFYSMRESVFLAKERGSFPLFSESRYVKGDLPIKNPQVKWGGLRWDKLRDLVKNGIRNAWTTTVAPTGTIAMIADTSNAIEPTFALIYKKSVSLGDFYYISEPFKKYLEETKQINNSELLEEVSRHLGSIQKIEGFPIGIKKAFVTAMDISWEDHILTQSLCQRWISNSISKTINLPPDATIEDVKKAYKLAYSLGCKGITVYRDGSRHEQVMHRPKIEEPLCSQCGGKLIKEAGCEKCVDCSFSPSCSIS